MHHNCPYFHDEDLMPEQLRMVLEERLQNFLVTGEQIPEQADAPPWGQTRQQQVQGETQGARDRALSSMVDNICSLASSVRLYSADKPEIGQRLSHEVIHRIGEGFAHSNEINAINALDRLRAKVDRVPAEKQLKLVRSMGLQSKRAEFLETAIGNAPEGIRRDALCTALEGEIQDNLDQYESSVYRSVVRSQLPEILKELLHESAMLSDTADKMQYYFGISSGMWDMKNGHWQEIPWDIFEQGKQLLERDESIRRLAEILGRSEGRTAGKQKAQKQVEFWKKERISQELYLGRSEIEGIEFGDDINILLPGEYAQLSDPDSEFRFYKELLDGELLVSRFRKNDMKQKTRLVKETRTVSFDQPLGPMVLCIDTSGSMAGWPEKVAKALSMALVHICWQENRKLYAVLFSTETREMDLSDMESVLPEFASYFSMEFRGGTDLRPALRTSLEKMNRENFRNADLLIVSDFRVPKIMLKQGRFLEQTRQAGGNRIHALTIGQHPIIDSYNMFDSQWHYRVSMKEQALGITGLVQL